MTDINVVAFVGSLRADSFNRKLYEAALAIAPEHIHITELTGWEDWPIFNADTMAKGFPDAVLAAGKVMTAADALVFVSPEYNYSIPGGLKNAIDWLSRIGNPGPTPFSLKPVAIMGASMGPVGTARMQYHLRQVMVFLDAHPINKPEIMLGSAQNNFDETGQLTNEVTVKLIGQLLDNLALHVARFGD